MIIDPQFSPQEAELFLVLAGSKPPQAMQADMRPLADDFRRAQQQVSGLQQGLGRLVARDLMGLDGATAEQIAKSTQAMTSAPPYYLPTLGDHYQQMAAYTETSADEFLRLKVDSIVILASLLVAIVIDLIIMYYNSEFGLKLMAAEFAIAGHRHRRHAGQGVRDRAGRPGQGRAGRGRRVGRWGPGRGRAQRRPRDLVQRDAGQRLELELGYFLR